MGNLETVKTPIKAVKCSFLSRSALQSIWRPMCCKCRINIFWLVWFFMSQSTNFKSCRDGSSWVEPVLSSGYSVTLWINNFTKLFAGQTLEKNSIISWHFFLGPVFRCSSSQTFCSIWVKPQFIKVMIIIIHGNRWPSLTVAWMNIIKVDLVLLVTRINWNINKSRIIVASSLRHNYAPKHFWNAHADVYSRASGLKLNQSSRNCPGWADFLLLNNAIRKWQNRMNWLMKYGYNI